MDTLVRVNKRYLRKYFEHFKRVLKNDGKMLIHLPCTSSPYSIKKGFISLDSNEISDLMISNGFSEYTLDFSTIKHGVLLKYCIPTGNK